MKVIIGDTDGKPMKSAEESPEGGQDFVAASHGTGVDSARRNEQKQRMSDACAVQVLAYRGAFEEQAVRSFFKISSRYLFPAKSHATRSVERHRSIRSQRASGTRQRSKRDGLSRYVRVSGFRRMAGHSGQLSEPGKVILQPVSSVTRSSAGRVAEFVHRGRSVLAACRQFRDTLQGDE
jgi:hypothetical protein